MVPNVSRSIFSGQSNDEIISRVAYSLEFAKNTIQHLIIDGHYPSENDPWYAKPEKIIAETSFLLVFAKAVSDNKAIYQKYNALANIISPLARSKSFLINICLKPTLALDYATAHICLDYAGFPDPNFDRILADSLNSIAHKGIERLPYRELEQAWLYSIWKKIEIPKNFKKWIRLSVLYKTVDIFSESTDGVYALTHAIIYAAFDKIDIPKSQIEKVINLVESLLIRYIDEQNYDIAGELLMAWPLFGRKYSPVAEFGLHCLLYIESRVGFMPAPGLDLSKINVENINQRRSYIYSHNYHTVCVLGLLGSTLLKEISTISENCIKMTSSRELFAELEEEILSDQSVHWVEVYKQLDEQKKQTLFPWLYHVILFRSIKRKNYKKASQIIQQTKNIGRSNNILFVQTNQLLMRLSRHATIITEP